MDSRILAIARFEFLRFFDRKGELVSLGLLLILALLRFGGDVVMKSLTPHGTPIAIEAAASDVPRQGERDRFRFIPVLPDQRHDTVRRIRAGELAGLLVPEGATGYRLHAPKAVYWDAVLAEQLLPIHRNVAARRHGISPADVQGIVLTPSIIIEPLAAATSPDSHSTGILTIALVVLTLFGILSAQQVMVQGIAGEKSGRICEIVLAAIPPETWLDGKALASAMHGTKTLVCYTTYALLAALVLKLVQPAQLLTLLGDWPRCLAIGTLCLAGLLLWSMVFALIATLLPSAHSPIRNTLFLLPASCLLLCLNGIREPENPLLIALSFVPPTAPFAMSLRVAADTTSAGELVASVVLMICGGLLLRRVAIRCFSDAVLGRRR